ncbi:hypothetical protein HDV03_005368 [Kappamyces sp. JEL0829]|nr:hypothetical protein HDV03_005368 [Kappamyces sp. JEL0829]
MNTISKRLNEPAGPTWRQTYKGLQLLEFLIINGSEQVIDDAKRRIYEIKGCETYQYMDDKRKDQGINIRHRATKIIELLGSDDMIRAERQKAKDNKSKYTGVSSYDMRSGSSSSGGFGGSSTRYGGFGSDSVRSSGGFRDEVSSEPYKSAPIKEESPVEAIKAEPAKPAVPVVNLLDFGDDDFSGFVTAPAETPLPANNVPAFPAPPASNATGFASFSAQQPLFASFPPAPTHPASVSATANSTAVGLGQYSTPVKSPVSPPTQQFATFPAPTNTFPAAGFPSPMNPSQPQGFQAFPAASSTPRAAALVDDFGDFQSVSQTPVQPKPAGKTPSEDHFSKLVSLDAFSLGSTGAKKDAPGPSLNSLGGTSNFLN